MNVQETHYMSDYWFFNNIYMMGEMPEERKKSTVVPTHKKCEKQKVENYREITLLNSCYNLRSNILNEKLKPQAERVLLEWILKREILHRYIV
jgi:hypothetical protein